MITALAALVIGCALPLLATWLTFRALGADTHLVYWTLTNNVRYAANPISAREAMERGLSYFVPFLLATAPLWWGTARSLRLWDDPYRPLLLVGVLVATVPAAALGFRFFPHYFVQFYAPLAAASAPWLLGVLSAPSTRTARLVIGWSALMLFGFMLANAYVYLGGTRVYRERDPVFGAVAARLQRDACAAGATMFVWGYAPVFYYHADIPPASRFIVLAQSGLTTYIAGNLGSVRGDTMAKNVVVPRHWDWLMEDLEARRATFIIDTAPAGIFRWNKYPLEQYPRLAAYVRESFDLVDEIGKVRIYRRKACGQR